MKVFMSADMEGICGIVRSDMTERSHYDFGRARELMTGDVNAAAEAAFDAGATDVWVRDAHGSANNILIDRLDPRVRLIQGWAEVARMMDGIDSSFDAAMLIGYHARAMTPDGAISHTMIMATRRLWYNGVELGEYGISAAHAGAFGVPLVMVSGDERLCTEVGEVLGPQVATAAVKRALTRECAACLPLEEARGLIGQAVAKGLAAAPTAEPFVPTSPIEVKLEYHKPIHAHAASLIPTVERVDDTTVRALVADGLAAANMVEILLRMA